MFPTVAIAVVVLLGSLSCSCDRQKTTVKRTGPDGSIVLDSTKYQHWIRCTAVGPPFYDCDVVDQADKLVSRNRYRLTGNHQFNPSDPEEYTDWAGSCRILLSRGRELVCAEPPRPAGVPASAVWRAYGCGMFLDCVPIDAESCNCALYDDMSGTETLRGRAVKSDSGTCTTSDRPQFRCSYESGERRVRSSQLSEL